MRKVVDAIVAEDILREEVTMLKNRVRDLEAQNAALSASPAKGRDEGYCTMSSGQPQPSNGHLEDLPEEPEQWLLPAEPCSTEMEDWSMSQEELPVVTLDDGQQLMRGGRLLTNLRRQNSENEWMWNSNDFLTSTTAETDSESEAISQLLQQKVSWIHEVVYVVHKIICTLFWDRLFTPKMKTLRAPSSPTNFTNLSTYVRLQRAVSSPTSRVKQTMRTTTTKRTKHLVCRSDVYGCAVKSH